VGGEGRYVSDDLARDMGTVLFTDSPWAESQVPLRDSKIALVTTAGYCVKGQEPFREQKFRGDFAYRALPRDITLSRLSVGRALLDHRLPLLDPNILFPIDRLKELKEEGVVKDVALNHYSFSGYCTDYDPLVGGSAKEVARRLRYEGVDKVVVIAASILSQETAVLVQRVIEEDGLPTVSLLYTAEAVKNLKPPRACLLGKASLYRLEEYLDKAAQRRLLLRLLEQFETQKRGAPCAEIAG
jgi:D-proline reductase (dithiol) PrdB